jgi:PKD domain
MSAHAGHRVVGYYATLLIAFAGCLFAPGMAEAASFDYTPVRISTSGMGPFSWGFTSSEGEDSEYGWVGYELSSESEWHRCIGYSTNVSLSNVPDGAYTVTIANDLSGDWLLLHGLSFSGLAEQCTHTSDAPSKPATSDTIYVDSTPPEVSSPRVLVAGKQVTLLVSASDATTGIASFRFRWGDGKVSSSLNGSESHDYASFGDYSGSVTVYDNAGNSTAQPFTADLPAPASHDGSLPGSSGTHGAPAEGGTSPCTKAIQSAKNALGRARNAERRWKASRGAAAQKWHEVFLRRRHTAQKAARHAKAIC